jgi:hypothetical protein
MSTVANVSSQHRSQNTSCLSRVFNCVCSNTTTAKTVKVAALIIGVALMATACAIPMSVTLGTALAYVGLVAIVASAYSLIISAILSNRNPSTSSFFNRQPVGVISGGTLHTTFADVKARPAYYLNLITRSADAFRGRVSLTNGAEGQAIDAHGISREFISTLIRYLTESDTPTISLDETKFPKLEAGESEQPYERLGMLYSIIDQKNTFSTSNFQTGALFNPSFFEIVKKVAMDSSDDELREEVVRQTGAAGGGIAGILAPLILQRGSEEALENYVAASNRIPHVDQITIEDARQTLQETKECVDKYVKAARAFYRGATTDFQDKIRLTADSANLARSIQGEPITARGVENALVFLGISADYQTWLREKIQGSDDAWRMKFVSVITGYRSLSASTRINIRAAGQMNQAAGIYEIHTCWSSIELLTGLEKEDFLRGLDAVLDASYNCG